MAFSLKRKTASDPLTVAETALNDALGVFTEASANLDVAATNYAQVQADEQRRIERARARQAEAATQQAKAVRVKTALDNLLGTE